MFDIISLASNPLADPTINKRKVRIVNEQTRKRRAILLIFNVPSGRGELAIGLSFSILFNNFPNMAPDSFALFTNSCLTAVALSSTSFIFLLAISHYLYSPSFTF